MVNTVIYTRRFIQKNHNYSKENYKPVAYNSKYNTNIKKRVCFDEKSVKFGNMHVTSDTLLHKYLLMNQKLSFLNNLNGVILFTSYNCLTYIF